MTIASCCQPLLARRAPTHRGTIGARTTPRSVELRSTGRRTTRTGLRATRRTELALPAVMAAWRLRTLGPSIGARASLRSVELRSTGRRATRTGLRATRRTELALPAVMAAWRLRTLGPSIGARTTLPAIELRSIVRRATRTGLRVACRTELALPALMATRRLRTLGLNHRGQGLAAGHRTVIHPISLPAPAATRSVGCRSTLRWPWQTWRSNPTKGHRRPRRRRGRAAVWQASAYHLGRGLGTAAGRQRLCLARAAPAGLRYLPTLAVEPDGRGRGEDLGPALGVPRRTGPADRARRLSPPRPAAIGYTIVEQSSNVSFGEIGEHRQQSPNAGGAMAVQ